jgi:hypothetical protein
MLFATIKLIDVLDGRISYFILAWVPVAVVIVFMLRGMIARRKRGDK